MLNNENIPETEYVLKHLLQSGFVFEASKKGEVPITIHRAIGPNKTVNLLPTFEKLYLECQKKKNYKASHMVSEITSLLVAADLGIAQEFLVELEVQNSMPKMLQRLRQDLKTASIKNEGGDEDC